MSGARDIWMDRPVAFAEFTIREGDAVGAAFNASASEGSYLLLTLSMRWADSGEPVFKDTEEIWQLPYRLRPTLARLAAKAAFVNGMGEDPDNPPVPLRVVSSNGAEEVVAAPSP